MSLHLPGKPGRERATVKRSRRTALGAVVGASVVLLGGCSDEAARFGMPEPYSEQGEHTLALWQGAWIAALITGVIVWGLIFWACWRYRRRSADEVPVQTRYNLPLEIFYTIAPVLTVIVLFAHTVDTQNEVLDEAGAENVVEVVGQQWQWTFNYGMGEADISADDDLTDDEFAYDEYAYEIGTMSYIPTLVLPENTTTRFNLHAADVIHDFGVPHFNIKMDVVPGRVNHYNVTTKDATATIDPNATDSDSLIVGDTFRGACYELCGLYHTRMLFRVAVVSQDDYELYLDTLADRGFAGSSPLFGGGKSTNEPDQVPDEAEGANA